MLEVLFFLLEKRMQLVCTTFSTESWRPEAGGSEKNYGRRFEAAAGVAGAVKYTANRHTAHHYAIGGVELFLLSKGNFSLSRARLVRLHFGGCFHCTVLPLVSWVDLTVIFLFNWKLTFLVCHLSFRFSKEISREFLEHLFLDFNFTANWIELMNITNSDI